jgi:hypothetical protein
MHYYDALKLMFNVVNLENFYSEKKVYLNVLKIY